MADAILTRFNAQNLVTVASLAILVGTEVFAAAFAAGWAIAGLFELGSTVQYVLMAAFGGLALWGMIGFVRNALRIEPVVEKG